jgi:intein/homing endonuclease
MVKNNQISQGEGEILDLKLNSSLSIADNSDFPIIGIGASSGRLEPLDRIEKNIGIILFGMGADKEKNGFVLVKDPALAKFKSIHRNTIEGVIAVIVSSSKELPTKLIALLNYFLEINLVSETRIKSEKDLNKMVLFSFRFHGNRKMSYKKRVYSACQFGF